MATQAQALPKKKGLSRQLLEERIAYLFISPYLLALLIFTLGAMVYALFISFTDLRLINTPKFVGLQEYQRVLADRHFLKALGNTVAFSVVVVFCQTWLALLMAVALNAKLWGLKFFRTSWYAPSVTSSAVISLIF